MDPTGSLPKGLSLVPKPAVQGPVQPVKPAVQGPVQQVKPTAPTAGVPQSIQAQPTLDQLMAQAQGLLSTEPGVSGEGVVAPTGYVSPYSPLEDTIREGQKDELTAFAKQGGKLTDEEKEAMFQEERRRIREQVNALQSASAQERAEQRKLTEGRLGSTTAAQARRGLIGSSFGQAQEANVNQAGKELEDLISTKYAIKISDLEGDAKESAIKNIEKRTKELSEKTDKYIASLNEVQATRNNQLKQFLAGQLQNGQDINLYSDEQLAQAYGITAAEAKLMKATAGAEAELGKQQALADRIKQSSADVKDFYAIYGRAPQSSAELAGFKSQMKVADKGGAGVTDADALASQPAYAKLTTTQKTQANSLNNLVRELNNYYNEISTNVDESGVNLTGADSAVLETKLNAILFAAAQAEGTGALQKADREVIEKIIPNPTSFMGAIGTLVKGGKEGSLAKIEDQISKYTNNLKTLGLTPVDAGSIVQEGVTETGGAGVWYSPDGKSQAVLDTPEEIAEAKSAGWHQ